jgi:hypothetical protein
MLSLFLLLNSLPSGGKDLAPIDGNIFRGFDQYIERSLGSLTKG